MNDMKIIKYNDRAFSIDKVFDIKIASGRIYTTTKKWYCNYYKVIITTSKEAIVSNEKYLKYNFNTDGGEAFYKKIDEKYKLWQDQIKENETKIIENYRKY